MPHWLLAMLWFLAAWTTAFICAASIVWARNRMRMIPEQITPRDWLKVTVAFFLLGIVIAISLGAGTALFEALRRSVGDRVVTAISFAVVGVVVVFAVAMKRRRLMPR